MDAGQFKYRGFISYSHRNRRWGEWLHRALERYRVPSRLVGTVGHYGPLPRRLFPIFRDRDELPTAGALGEALATALASSHCFVLVCSPAAAASRWVNEEVLQFKRLGGEGRILCLIVDGEPHATAAGHPERECFPAALRFKLGADGELSSEPAEPLAADARDTGDGRDNARLKIIAGLLGISFGELRQRDLQARNRRLGVVAAITTGVAALTLVLAVQAVLARRAAEKSRQQGEDLIAFMLGDLRSKLEPLGKLDILDAVGDKAMGYFDQLDRGNLSEAALIARAKALRQIGDVRFQQGRPADAAEAIAAALVLNRAVAQRHPDDLDLQFELGQTEFWVAASALRAEQFDRAAEHFEAYRAISQGLVDREPKNSKWQLELAYAESNLAALENQRKRPEPELTHAQKAIDLLLAIEPKTDDVRSTLTISYSWQGSALQRLGRAREAEAAMQPQVERSRELLQAKPDDQRRRYNFGTKLSAWGLAALAANSADDAAAASREGIAVAQALVANDSTNADYRSLLGAHQYIDAASQMLEGHRDEARRGFVRAAGIFGDLLAQDPKNARTRTFFNATQTQRFELALLDADLASARDAVRNGDPGCEPSASDPQKNSTDPTVCMGLAIRAWELARIEGLPAAEIDARRADVERHRSAAAERGDVTLIEALSIKALILDGRGEEAVQRLGKLSANGYMPPELWAFLRRHCKGDIRHIASLSCVSADSSTQALSERSKSSP